MGCWMRPMDRWMVNFRGKPWEKPWVLTQENPWESPLKILTNTLIMDLGWMLVGRCCLFSAWSFSAFQEMCVFRVYCCMFSYLYTAFHIHPRPFWSIFSKPRCHDMDGSRVLWIRYCSVSWGDFSSVRVLQQLHRLLQWCSGRFFV